MSNQGFAAIIGLVVSLAVGATANTAKPVKCTAVHDGVQHTAQVTCHFNSDVSSLVPVSLSVEFYPGGQNNKSVSVVECLWEADHDGCQMKKDRYSFSRSPSAGPGEMILEIDNVTGNDAGRYVCQQMSAKRSNTPSWPCALSVEDHPQPNEVTTITSDDHSGKGVSDSSGVTGATDKEEDGMDVSTLLPAILVPVVLVVIAVIVAYLIWRKRRQSRESRKGEKTDEEEALPVSATPLPYSDDPKATEKPEDEALNSTEMPEKAAPNSTEIPEKEAPNSTEMPEKEAPDATKLPEPQENENGTSEGDPLVVTDKGFDHGLETKPV